MGLANYFNALLKKCRVISSLKFSSKVERGIGLFAEYCLEYSPVGLNTIINIHFKPAQHNRDNPVPSVEVPNFQRFLPSCTSSSDQIKKLAWFY